MNDDETKDDTIQESVKDEEELSDTDLYDDTVIGIVDERCKDKDMRGTPPEFKKKYGDKWLDVIYATATNMAKKQSIKESSYLKNYEDFIGWLND